MTDKIGSGATPRGGQSAYKESGTSLIRSLNVHDLEFRYKDLARIDEEQAAALSNVEVEARDVLLNITGASIARCSQVPPDVLPARVNQHVSILRPKNGQLDSRFLSYLLVSDCTKNQLLNIGDKAGATRQALTKAQLQAFEIPVPPMEEQKRIVAVLDPAFAALDRARAHAHAHAEVSLADADELLEASKNEVFEHSRLKGRRVSLADITSIDSTLVDPRRPEFFDMRHIGAGNMVSGTDALVDVMTARQECLKSGKYLFDDTMVLYSKIRPYLRKVGRPDFTGVCSAYVYPLSPSPELDRDFLFHVLHTKDFTEYAISGSDRAGMPKVNREHLFKYEFWLPPLAAQLEAASKIDLVMEATARLNASLRLKLTDLANLRQSLLQKAFSGQLS